MFSAVDSGRHRHLEVLVHTDDRCYRVAALQNVLPSTALRNYPRESELKRYGKKALTMPWQLKRTTLRSLKSEVDPIPLQVQYRRTITPEDSLRIEPKGVSIEITAPQFDQHSGTATRVALVLKRTYGKG